MTTFNGEVVSTAGEIISTATPETKPAVIMPPPSRVKSDPELWIQSGEVADMLSYCRPHGSKMERKFIAKFIAPLGVKYDKKGNAYKVIGDNPTVLWSSHTDTVHDIPGFQKIVYWQKPNGDVTFEVCHKDIPWAKQSSCLGADDTVGVWLMMEMIRAKVPGLYIFHRGEEVGCIGSRWIAENNKKALEGIKFAIAFDRRDTKSIITHQMASRCCSDEFAKSLADQLGMGHQCDTGGSTTDTRSYVDLIPECTNLSVGYDGAHSRWETANIDYLFNLRDALLKIDVTKLVEKRKPGENDPLYKSYVYSGGSYHGDYHTGWWGSHYSSDKKETKNRDKKDGRNAFEIRRDHKGKSNWMDDYEWDGQFCLWFPKQKEAKPDARAHLSNADAIRLIKANPEAIADLLESFGCDAKGIRDYLIDTDFNQTIYL